MAMTRKDLDEMYSTMDIDGDGELTKLEFGHAFKKRFEDVDEAGFEALWLKIAGEKSSIDKAELFQYFGYKLTANGEVAAVDVSALSMTDDEVLQALQLQDTINEQKAKVEASRRKAISDRQPRLGSRESSNVTRVMLAPALNKCMENNDKRVSFLVCCELGDQAAVVAALEEEGFNPRLEDEKAESPLHKLARHPNMDIRTLKKLLHHPLIKPSMKIDLNTQDKQGKTPTHIAAEYGSLSALKLFLECQSDATIRNNNGWTVLHSAVGCQAGTKVRLEICRELLDHPNVQSYRDLLVSMKDTHKRTALHIASFTPDAEDVVALLLNRGANRDLADISGLKPVELATRTGRRRSKDLLEMDPSDSAPAPA